jgi:transposase
VIEEVVVVEQPALLPVPEPNASPPEAATRPADARVVRAVRTQVEWAPRALDELLPPDHPARAIWACLERLDLAGFYGSVKAVTHRAGRPASDPQVLLALWLYATADAVGSARRLARLCAEHDAYRWLRGGVPVDYHLLAEFRVAHQRELDELLSQILAVLMAEELLTLEHVAQDGMKVRASAGAASFRGAERLQECLAAARAQVEALKRERGHHERQYTQRKLAAQERAARERLERVEAALQLLPAAQAAKDRQERTLAAPRRGKVKEPRVSTTDAEARVMHMPDGGFRPAVNVELATDVTSQVIVGVAISTRGSDQGEALPMETQVHERTAVHPDGYLIDGGFVKRDDITALEQAGITVYAPLRPARTPTSGRAATDPRPDDSPEVQAWRARMGTVAAKAIYKERAATAECVNARCRQHGIHQFSVRGVDKMLSVMLLAVITHDLLRWIALTTTSSSA